MRLLMPFYTVGVSLGIVLPFLFFVLLLANSYTSPTLARTSVWRNVGVVQREFVPMLAINLSGIAVFCSTFLCGILHIFCLRAKKKMLGVAAQRHIACVTNVLAVFNRPVCHSVCKTMRHFVARCFSATTYIQMAITFPVQGSAKQQATVRLRYKPR